MTKVRFICRTCGHTFVAEIFEDGEAEEKRLRGGPVRCPKCRNTSVEKR